MTTPLRPRKWKAPLRRGERIVAGPRGAFTLPEAASFLEITEKQVLALFAGGALVSEGGPELAFPRAYVLAYSEHRAPLAEEVGSENREPELLER